MSRIIAYRAACSLPLFHNFEGRKVVVVGSIRRRRWKAELLTAAGANVLHVARAGPKASSRAPRSPSAISRTRGGTRFVDAAPCALRPRQHHRPARIQRRSVRNDRQSLAGGDRDLHRWRGSGARPVDPRADRKRSTAGAVRLGRGRQTHGVRGSSYRFRDLGERRTFWQRFAAAAWADPDRTPRMPISRRLQAASRADKGRVILVGAGPGDPELLL